MAVKVLVVDDSALMRKHLTGLLTGAGFEVVLARNGEEAVEQVLAVKPDVVTLDINMPEMDGLTALSQIMTVRPTPVVMVSSLTNKGALATLEALAMGAVDYVAKPGGTISLSIEDIADDLVRKVRAASTARMKGVRTRADISVAAPASSVSPQAASRQARTSAPSSISSPRQASFGLVIIGVSTGGPRTLEEILPSLPGNFPWAVLVAQHMPGSFTKAFAQRMDTLCQMTVREAGPLDEIEPGTITIARGGTDLVVTNRSGRLFTTSRPESAAHLWHPSVDVLMESALAHVVADKLMGVQLTGMGYDGAAAMATLHQKGGHTIAESEESAVVFGMPKELIARGGASMILPAAKVAGQILRWVR